MGLLVESRAKSVVYLTRSLTKAGTAAVSLVDLMFSRGESRVTSSRGAERISFSVGWDVTPLLQFCWKGLAETFFTLAKVLRCKAKLCINGVLQEKDEQQASNKGVLTLVKGSLFMWLLIKSVLCSSWLLHAFCMCLTLFYKQNRHKSSCTCFVSAKRSFATFAPKQRAFA